MLRFLTSGESHGKALVAILEGLPAGLVLDLEFLNKELARRQLGYGRGGRMKIEQDTVEILSGVRFGKTLGSPIALVIENRDWKNWRDKMAVEPGSGGFEPITRPRPGHADLAGLLKYGETDIRNILERSSARETAARVAIGAVAKTLLKMMEISIFSHVTRIGREEAKINRLPDMKDLEEIDKSPVRCLDSRASQKMVEEIDRATEEKDSLGGTFEVLVFGCPPGLGSYTSWETRLDGRLSRALMSIPAIKGVEIGEGFKLAVLRGSQAHDEIFYEAGKDFYRKTNRAGGIEAGITNGETLVLRAAMKPLPTLGRPLGTVDVITKQPAEAFRERADICAVPAAAVIGEAVVAIEVARAALEKFGGDSLGDFKDNYRNYRERIKKL